MHKGGHQHKNLISPPKNKYEASILQTNSIVPQKTCQLYGYKPLNVQILQSNSIIPQLTCRPTDTSLLTNFLDFPLEFGIICIEIILQYQGRITHQYTPYDIDDVRIL